VVEWTRTPPAAKKIMEKTVGSLRCWPGGLCLSRSIGDMDVGEFIVPIPHVKQVKFIPFIYRMQGRGFLLAC